MALRIWFTAEDDPARPEGDAGPGERGRPERVAGRGPRTAARAPRSVLAHEIDYFARTAGGVPSGLPPLLHRERSRGAGARPPRLTARPSPGCSRAAQATTNVAAYRSMFGMSDTARITVTLPADQVAEIRRLTDNVSGYVATAVARQIRHQLLAEELRQYRSEHGEFTDDERAAARARIRRTTGEGSDAA